MNIFDRDWNKAVAARLAVIERERGNARPVDPGASETQGEFSNTLYRHPLLVNSMYWHCSDTLATVLCFDLTPPLFPTIYVDAIRMLRETMRHKIAARPYLCHSQTIVALRENTQTLLARLVMLNLEYLLKAAPS